MVLMVVDVFFIVICFDIFPFIRSADNASMQRMKFPLVLGFPFTLSRVKWSAGGNLFRFLLPFSGSFAFFGTFLPQLPFHSCFLLQRHLPSRRSCIRNIECLGGRFGSVLWKFPLPLIGMGRLPWVTPLLCLHYST